MNSRITGNAKVKTMLSRSRENIRTSMPVRARPSRSTAVARGREVAAAVTSSSSVVEPSIIDR